MNKPSCSSLFFYQNGKLVTVKQGNQHRAILRNDDMPLAEVQTGDTPATGLLATDDKGSVLNVQDSAGLEGHNFSAYGHDPNLPSMRITLGFNGEAYVPGAASYLLGLGYRSYSPRLRRFLAADSWSPFGQGGLNAYCYCEGDPVNFIDSSGHMPKRFVKPRPKLRRVELPNDEILKVSKNIAVNIGSSTAKSSSNSSLTPSSQAGGHTAHTEAGLTSGETAARRDSPATIPKMPTPGSPIPSTDSSPAGSRSGSPLPDAAPPQPLFVRSFVEAPRSLFHSRASEIRQSTDAFPRAPSRWD
ncbi:MULTISPECIES: RHS repeat-associated core domain-containing protein [Pseudomonas]|uniref:RHS repeat-associated core domain-containing protein n=1 Tax=Pseudomonas TaxID=286 RepID=UPI0020C269C0|nr:MULTISPECIES: RHS repeat-associated core domain-containing protein [Pseudomonas]MDH1575973.1 RHS repeat-associated core domain-containing protein [Pseudomonas sp. GD03746]UTL80944.1 RHS repeat-associated core domain-containing protein [Pseudomonas putida]